MGDHPSAWIVLASVAAVVGAAIVLFWPRQNERDFTIRRFIAAPREKIWNLYRSHTMNPETIALSKSLVSSRVVDENEKIHELTLDWSGGHRTHLVTMRSQTLVEVEPEVCVTRVLDLDGKPFPYGADGYERLELFEHPGGTSATLSFRGVTGSLFQHLVLQYVYRAYSRRLQRICEVGPPVASAGNRRSLWISIVLSVLAVGSFTWLLGWVIGLLLVGLLVIHEYGHWLAMRLTGQPAPKVILIPFLGGVAVANHPHKSLFDDAFCSLMGAGFSALLCLVLLLAAITLGLPEQIGSPNNFDADFPVPQTLAMVAVGVSIFIGWLNAFQLLPVLPLDGGHILRSVAQSISARWARRLLLAVTVVGIVGFAYIGLFILAGILCLGALQAWHMEQKSPKARPMRAVGLIAICVGYGLTLAVHVGAALYGTYVFSRVVV